MVSLLVMQKLWVVVAVMAYLFVMPFAVSAAGLVPCGGSLPEKPCQTCDVVKLTNNVVAWLVMILGTIAAILIIVAGVRLVTSGGNTSAMEQAKSSMTNLIIGYLIVLSAWLVLDYGLKALLIQDGANSFGVWNTISCVDQPKSQYKDVVQEKVVYIPIGAGLSNIPGWTYVSTGGSSGGGGDSGQAGGGGFYTAPCTRSPGPASESIYSCTVQQAQCTGEGGIPTLNAARTVLTCTPKKVVGEGGTGGGGGGGSCKILSSGPCSVTSLRQTFGSRAEDASRICNKESGGNPVESRSDICCGPGANCSGAPSFSGGLFQVNIIANAKLIPGCSIGSFYRPNCLPGKKCQAEGSCVRRNAKGICTGWSCTIVRNPAYNTCMQGARNTTTNLMVTKKLYNDSAFQPWANSRNLCGVK